MTFQRATPHHQLHLRYTRQPGFGHRPGGQHHLQPRRAGPGDQRNGTDGGRTTYVYDTRDNLWELIDANRHTTVFTYDRSNRQLSETRPGGQRLSYTYDGAPAT
ncbi:MAG: hypothetical protein JKP90_06725 [Desulfofustis sp. PB-SRB1]|nr:hypothetical protein [Desulfofustis sp. PB-SRB1]